MDTQNGITLPVKNNQSIFNSMRAAHVGLRTIDFEGLINWYVEKLDFRVIKKFSNGDLKMAFLAPANDDNFWIEILTGGSTVAIQNSALTISSGFQHFCIEVNSVDDTLAELANRGIDVVRGPFNVPAIAMRCCFINDLYGNVIEFAERI